MARSSLACRSRPASPDHQPRQGVLRRSGQPARLVTLLTSPSKRPLLQRCATARDVMSAFPNAGRLVVLKRWATTSGLGHTTSSAHRTHRRRGALVIADSPTSCGGEPRLPWVSNSCPCAERPRAPRQLAIDIAPGRHHVRHGAESAGCVGSCSRSLACGVRQDTDHGLHVYVASSNAGTVVVRARPWPCTGAGARPTPTCVSTAAW